MMNLPASQKRGGGSLDGYFESQHISVEFKSSLDIFSFEPQMSNLFGSYQMIPLQSQGLRSLTAYPYFCRIIAQWHITIPRRTRIANNGRLRHA